MVIDLPGTYSLEPLSPDEAVVLRVLDGELAAAPDALVVVADACSLERSLPFVAQVLLRGRPTCLVLTMIDELAARGGTLDLARLERALGIPVLGVIGHRGRGLDALVRLLGRPEDWSRPVLPPPSDPLERVALGRLGVRERRGRAARDPPHDRGDRPRRAAPGRGHAAVRRGDGDVLPADLRVGRRPRWTRSTRASSRPRRSLHAALPPGLLVDFLADGLVAGVGAVIAFLPQIALLFGLLYLLEDVGYMARAAFVVDRLMGRVGLEGRAFVALLSSYACAVPGIMATRTIPSPRDRLVTILVAPLMTCSARLPVYALLIGAFVPAVPVWGPLGLQGLVLLALYLLGSVSALVMAALFERTLLPSSALPFYLELPSYRMPTAKLWLSQVWKSAWAFVRRAGTIILAVSVVLWVLLHFPRSEPPPGATPARGGAPRARAQLRGHPRAARSSR